jgi:uncharacterized protein
MEQIYHPNTPLSGRKVEYQKMRDLLESTESELLALVGRRRVGKTFLIKKAYEKEIVFHMTGIQKATRKEQLNNFAEARIKFFPDSEFLITPKTWQEAFAQLKKLMGKPKNKMRVLFFDELPWIAGKSIEFLKLFDNFWNSWAVDNNVIIVICGSSASWMIKKIINNKGGLHNRVTQRIFLSPFTLLETETYFRSKQINLTRIEIASIYMAMGGIPFYLREVKRGDTAVQAINNAFFGKSAPLYNEFENLYEALFTNHEKHIAVIKVLASRWKGFTRKELLDTLNIATGGGMTEILGELESSSFITTSIPYGKVERDKLYRLTDEYSLFYLNFIESNKNISQYWNKKFRTPEALSWRGYAFESLCMKHIDQIKNGLGISGIFTTEASFIKRKDENSDGCQIDLLIDRADNAINICEMKFSDSEYNFTADDQNDFGNKQSVFSAISQTEKQIFTTLISANNVKINKYTYSVDKILNINNIFE